MSDIDDMFTDYFIGGQPPQEHDEQVRAEAKSESDELNARAVQHQKIQQAGEDVVNELLGAPRKPVKPPEPVV